MHKIVYQTDAAGLYVGLVEASPSPLEFGAYLIPGGGVEIAPPDEIAGHVRRWNGNTWKQVADHRGETWYMERIPVLIDFLDDPSELGLSSTPPDPTLDDLRSAKLDGINAAAAALLAAGAPVDGGLHVALDDGSRADLTAMAATATAASAGSVSWPESYSRGWIAIENTRIPLPAPVDGLALAVAVGNYYASIIQHRRDLKDAALAAEDEAALATIDIVAGWPAS
ncbi:hypothetical protein CXZ10_20420 [Pleomorphomonas diazotrophica]|uniref:DUF4376 domain-containing protein n=1 Tax=Pleomorphomonas diazotrophica TaxID=1166257 RepID=A0A1I4V5Z8_9HYPH|nr:hypothetical protein [Pleomorphomonas diazotrophica]PKR87411.1 hypothetical protein CXZ10_20420 [Pleomorphomonas diazotrophica]SFM96573.1 hypothetical protein SAMN05192571_11098 [Pleomorphomonas diazotrophica]